MSCVEKHSCYLKAGGLLKCRTWHSETRIYKGSGTAGGIFDTAFLMDAGFLSLALPRELRCSEVRQNTHCVMCSYFLSLINAGYFIAPYIQLYKRKKRSSNVYLILTFSWDKAKRSYLCLPVVRNGTISLRQAGMKSSRNEVTRNVHLLQQATKT
jgi:hypothetical protein